MWNGENAIGQNEEAFKSSGVQLRKKRKQGKLL
jgi:hypothetical protein